MGFLNLNLNPKPNDQSPKKKHKHTKPRQSKPEQKPKPTYSPIPSSEEAIAELELKDPDHPVHKIPLAKREKMRAKGINPVLRAEMDAALKGKGGIWAKIGDHTSNGLAFTFPSI